MAVAQAHDKKSHRKDLEASQSALSAYLTGKAEVNDDGEDGAGDPNAKGTASFLLADERTICYGFGLTGAEAPKARPASRPAIRAPRVGARCSRIRASSPHSAAS